LLSIQVDTDKLRSWWTLPGSDWCDVWENTDASLQYLI